MIIDPCEVCGKSTRELEDLRREVQEFKTSGRVNVTALLAGLDAIKRTLQAGALTPTVVSMITVLTYRLIPPPTGTGELLGPTYDELMKDRDALRDERDELAATLANERGEGAPPHPSFKWDVGAGYEGAWQSTVIRDAEGWPVSVRRCLPTRWTFDGGRTSHPSARAAMRAAAGVKS